nr:oxidoreductase [Pseudomonas sp.]
MCNQLTIEPLGRTLDVAEGQTLLDAALRSGVYIPHACGHGLCGTCKVQVTSGEVDHGAANPLRRSWISSGEEGKTLACCATALSDVCIEADVDDEPDARASFPCGLWWATVTRIDTLTPTIKGLRLKLDQPIDFQAGQYVMVEIPGLGQRRAFSMPMPSDGGPCGEIELQVRRVPGAAGTGVLHEQLAVGDTLHVTGPYGRFFVRQSAAKPMLFVAGGSGLSSPRSMILDLLEQGCTLPITLVNGQRSREELYGHAEFVALADRHPNFSYVPVLSNEPEGSAWDGARGFAHDAAKAHFNGQFAGHKAYLCGPPPMVEAAIGALMQGRLFEDDIYTEKFLSAADANARAQPLFKRV